MSEWQKICAVSDIPQLGSRVVKHPKRDIAIFRNSEDDIFALHDKCPHKGGPLSQGIVHGKTVTCPLHSWNISLENGESQAPDVGCTRSFSVKVDAGEVYLQVK